MPAMTGRQNRVARDLHTILVYFKNISRNIGDPLFLDARTQREGRGLEAARVDLTELVHDIRSDLQADGYLPGS